MKLGFDRARARDWNWLFTTHRIPPHAPQHVQDQYFEFLDELGVPRGPTEWKLGPWEDEIPAQRAFFAGVDGPAACLVIGSTHPEKEWVPERWAALADALRERWGMVPVLVGGNSEREHATEAEIVRRARHPVISTLGIPFRALVGVLAGSELVVSLDTGPMHMAVALGVPTIALMGYTNPKRTGPYRHFGELLVDAYGDPGEDYPVSIAKRPGRTARITVDDVLTKVALWNERFRRR